VWRVVHHAIKRYGSPHAAIPTRAMRRVATRQIAPSLPAATRERPVHNQPCKAAASGRVQTCALMRRSFSPSSAPARPLAAALQ